MFGRAKILRKRTGKLYCIAHASEEPLRAVWIEVGPPGADKLYVAALRQWLAVKRQAAQTFAKSLEAKQNYELGPKSGGKVTADRIDDRRQGYFIDFKQVDRALNQGIKNKRRLSSTSSRGFAGRCHWRPKTPEQRQRLSRRSCAKAAVSLGSWTRTAA